MLIGMESVAREIHFYTLFEVVYLTRSSEARDQLADILVKTYAKLFRFLAEAKATTASTPSLASPKPS
jgi:hypothetical protein